MLGRCHSPFILIQVLIVIVRVYFPEWCSCKSVDFGLNLRQLQRRTIGVDSHLIEPHALFVALCMYTPVIPIVLLVEALAAKGIFAFRPQPCPAGESHRCGSHPAPPAYGSRLAGLVAWPGTVCESSADICMRSFAPPGVLLVFPGWMRSSRSAQNVVGGHIPNNPVR